MQRCCANIALPDTADGCWEWRGHRNHDGYGRLSLRFGVRNRRLVMAHRFMYEAFMGPIPPGLECDHLCKNRGCVNPAHLRAVPHAVNMEGRDYAKVRAVNASKTHCPQGHAYTSENTYRRPGGKGRDCLSCRRAVSARTAQRRKAERAARRA